MHHNHLTEPEFSILGEFLEFQNYKNTIMNNIVDKGLFLAGIISLQ